MLNGIIGVWTIFTRALMLRLPVVRPAKDSPEFFAYRRHWGREVARSLEFTAEVHGPPPGPGTLVVSTHSGFADLLALFAVIPPEARPFYIAKLEIGRIPIIGWQLVHYGDIVFDRSDAWARKKVLDEALAHLERGDSVVLFPEGTRSRTGEPKRQVHPALIEAALKHGLPIQPVAIRDTRDLLENPFKNMRRPTRGRVYFGDTRRDFSSVDEVWRAVLDLWEAGSR